MNQPAQFTPLATIEGDGEGPGNWRPLLNENGIPVWQDGDTNPVQFAINSVGEFIGNTSNTRVYSDLQGWAYITGARVIVVTSGFNKGSHFRTVGIPSLTSLAVNAIANQVTKEKARKAERGTFLAGHVRLPWVGSVMWAPSSSPRKSQGAVRIVGTQKTAFGDEESVALNLHLANPTDVIPFVTTVIERVLADRIDYDRTPEEGRVRLKSLPAPQTVGAAPGNLAAIGLPGGWQISRVSGFLGTVSAASGDQ